MNLKCALKCTFAESPLTGTMVATWYNVINCAVWGFLDVSVYLSEHMHFKSQIRIVSELLAMAYVAFQIPR